MEKRDQSVTLLVLALVVVTVIAFMAGRSCAPPVPAPLDPHGIDAGPGEREIAGRLDATLREADERLAQIEAEFTEDIEAFDRRQREEYERLIDGGDVDEVADFLRDWNKRRVRPEGRQ